MRVFVLGGVRGEADANPVVFCWAVLVCSPKPPAYSPPSSRQGPGTSGEQGEPMAEEIAGGTLETPTLLSFRPFLPAAVCHWL